MDYYLFTYPNCQKCEKLKEYLKTESVPIREYNLVERESKVKIREFITLVKRDKDGAVILPMLVAREGENVAAVLNTQEEFEAWWKSKA
jgi:glutaredoxin